MSDRIDDGGPAFPVADFDHQTFAPKTLAEARRLLSGMSLVDHYAGRALAGLCANPGGPLQANDRSGWGLVNCTMDQIAETAFDLAEAMIRHRATRAAAALATEKAHHG